QGRGQRRRDYRGRWGKIEGSGLRREGRWHRRGGMGGRKSGGGWGGVVHERGRDGGANFLKSCLLSLSRFQWQCAHKNTPRNGGLLPGFPFAGEKFCCVRRFSRPACASRRNRSQTGGITGEAANVATRGEKRWLHFQKS